MMARVCTTLGPIALFAVACLLLLDTSGSLFAEITSVLLVVGLPLYMYWDPPWAGVPHSIDEQGGEGSSTLVPGVLPVASVCCEHLNTHAILVTEAVCCEHLNTHAILVTEAVFPTYDVPMNSLPPPFGPHAIYHFPEPLDSEW